MNVLCHALGWAAIGCAAYWVFAIVLNKAGRAIYLSSRWMDYAAAASAAYLVLFGAGFGAWGIFWMVTR
jgi:hypothetical protein